MITPETIMQIKEHFAHQEFRGKDIAAYLELPDYRGSGGIIKYLNSQHMITPTMHGYRFRNGNTPDPVTPTVELATMEYTAPARLIKAGGYYIAENTILIADTLQNGKVTLYTTILEIDGETKHPRNKRLIFTHQHAPEEYAAIMSWLRANAADPSPCQSEDAQAALQLAEEATAKLDAANREIAMLQTKIAQFRALL